MFSKRDSSPQNNKMLNAATIRASSRYYSLFADIIHAQLTRNHTGQGLCSENDVLLCRCSTPFLETWIQCIYMAGLLTCFLRCAFPTRRSVAKGIASAVNVNLQQRDCSGLSPDSLLIAHPKRLCEPCTAKVEVIFKLPKFLSVYLRPENLIFCTMLEKGLTHTSRTMVSVANTAAALGSGDMDVFATPAMVALMENAAMRCVASHLPEGSTTVGSHMDIIHVKPSALGASVEATAELTEVDGRKLTFHVLACEGDKLIGEGTHVRYVVDRERFLAKL